MRLIEAFCAYAISYLKILKSCLFYYFVGTGSSCYSDPCQNGGSCTPGAYGGYDCYCYEPYYGMNCEYNITDGKYNASRHAALNIISKHNVSFYVFGDY